MISFKIALENHKLSKISKFSDDFVSLVCKGDRCYLTSETTTITALVEMTLLNKPSEDISVRLSKSYLTGLGEESYLTVSVTDCIKLSYSSSKAKHLYDVKISKQSSVANIDDVLAIISSKSEYDKVHTSIFGSLSRVANAINVPCRCYNKILYCEYEDSFILTKCDAPNFSLSSAILSKLCELSEFIYFLGNKIYIYNSDSEMHVVSSLYLPPKNFDYLNSKLKLHFDFSIDVDITSLKHYLKSFSPSDNVLCDFILSKKIINFVDGDRLFSVSLDFEEEDIESFELKNKDSLSDDELVAMLNDTGVVDALSGNKRSTLPSVRVPCRLVKGCLKSNKVKILVNSNMVVFKVGSIRVLTPRVDAGGEYVEG